MKKWLKNLLEVVQNYVDDLLYFAGLGLIAYGAAQVVECAGWISAGAGMIAYALMIARR